MEEAPLRTLHVQARAQGGRARVALLTGGAGGTSALLHGHASAGSPTAGGKQRTEPGGSGHHTAPRDAGGRRTRRGRVWKPEDLSPKKLTGPTWSDDGEPKTHRSIAITEHWGRATISQLAPSTDGFRSGPSGAFLTVIKGHIYKHQLSARFGQAERRHRHFSHTNTSCNCFLSPRRPGPRSPRVLPVPATR